jgi:uncharacterized protein YkwD
MVQETHRSRSRIAAVFLVSTSLLLSGFATDHARAGEVARNRSVMLRLTNDAREQRHRDALQLDRQLSRYAVRHSRAMANHGALFHTDDLAALLEGVDWSIGGENVGVGSSLDDLQATFMRSRLHRRNILRDAFDHTAIGVVQSDGSFWVTVIFYG